MENIFQCFKMAWVFSCKFLKKICIFSEHLFLKIPQDDCFWKLSKLTKVSVYGKPIERQWVSTSLQVSCDETLSTFKVNHDLENNDATVKCIAKFIEFWKTVNIHTAYADIHWRDLKRTVFVIQMITICKNLLTWVILPKKWQIKVVEASGAWQRIQEIAYPKPVMV